MENMVERELIELLNGTNDQIIIRLHITEDLTVVRSFAVIYVHTSRDKLIEIARVDGSQKERIHIHYFFHKPPSKEYHSRPISLDTVAHYVLLFRENWRLYLSRYYENYI